MKKIFQLRTIKISLKKNSSPISVKFRKKQCKNNPNKRGANLKYFQSFPYKMYYMESIVLRTKTATWKHRSIPKGGND